MAYNKETGMYEGYIYKIYNDVNDKVYIGQTRVTIDKRWNQHLYETKYKNRNSYLHNAMNELGIDKFHIVQLEKMSCKEKQDLIDKLNIKEQQYIYLFNTTDRNTGYNLTIGGDSIGKYGTVKIKQYTFDGELIKIWDSIISAAEYYNTRSGLICYCCQGKINFCSGYVWRYENDSFDKYSISEEAITKALSCFKIIQYDFHGNIISSYTRDQLIKIYKTFGYHQIIMVCKGNKKFYKKSIWKYEFDNFKEQDYIKTYKDNKKNKNNITKTGLSALELGRNIKGQIQPKHINCYDMENNFIATYHSIKEAGDAVGLKNPYNITLVCMGKRNHAKYYKWFYADDPNQPDKTKIIK